MTAELLIYALVAAGLIFWLRSILGTRNEDEPERPIPNIEIDKDGKMIDLNAGGEDKAAHKLALIEELANTPRDNMSIGDQAAQNGLENVVNADKSFDIYVFLQAAQDAFVFVVESFADGDRDTLQDLLNPQVFAAFDDAITTRENAKETMSAEIQSVKKSEIIEARVDGKMALITVRFWADERTVTKDENQNIISGHPDKTTTMRDVWTFSRDIKSRDPRWLVVETREDGAEDNETIPNTH